MTKHTLIIGAPRSGTGFVSAAAKSVGVDLGHEMDGADGRVDWKAAAKPAVCAKYDLVLHQVRHPLDTIASMHTLNAGSLDYLRKHTPAGIEDSLLLTCMKAWLAWVILCDSRCYKRYKLEDMVKLFPEVGVVNARSHDRLEWAQLLEADYDVGMAIMRQANKYSYITQ